MKYRIIGLVVCVAVILTSLIIQFRPTDGTERYHQHMEATPKAACTDHGEDVFCSHLPVVEIETGGATIPGEVTNEKDMFGETIYTTTEDGEAMTKVTVSIFDSETENNHLTDSPAIKTESMIRVRGHMSRLFEKSPYLLKFVDEQGVEKDLPVMGMDPHNEWVLYGPYMDKSLIRNYMFYNIAGEMMDYAPNVRFCEVFLDGDYRGLYLMVEALTNGDGCRLDLTVTEKHQKVSGYLCRIDRPVEAEMTMTREIYPLSERQNYGYGDLIIKYPGKDSISEKDAKQIELEISSFDKAMYSYDYDSKKYGYKTYIDVDSFVDYFLISELTKNLDAGAYSTYIYKRPGEKYKMCVWDFNNCCDNYPEDPVGHEGFTMTDRLYYIPLCRDEDFIEAVLSRYAKLRKTVFSDEYLQNYIDSTIAFLGDSVKRNEERWKDYYASGPLTPEERNQYTSEEAVDELKDWLLDRTEWLDENIHSLRQYCAQSKVKKYNEVTE